jgi:hypothetical protein
MKIIDALQGAWGPKNFGLIVLFYLILFLYKITPGIFFVEMLKVADIVLGI